MPRLPVVVLAEADEDAAEALEAWVRGFDWLSPLFEGHRHGLKGLHFAFAPPRETGLHPRVGAARAALVAQWRAFTQADLPGRLARQYGRAWRAAEESVQALIEADAALDFQGEEAARSQAAGRLLLDRVRGARHLGLLGRYRAACDDGRAPGHFFAAWAAFAQCFHLGFSAAAAEYLRLEWELAGASLPGGARPLLPAELAQPTARFLHAAGVPVLTDLTGPPSSSAGESRGVLP